MDRKILDSLNELFEKKKVKKLNLKYIKKELLLNDLNFNQLLDNLENNDNFYIQNKKVFRRLNEVISNKSKLTFLSALNKSFIFLFLFLPFFFGIDNVSYININTISNTSSRETLNISTSDILVNLTIDYLIILFCFSLKKIKIKNIFIAIKKISISIYQILIIIVTLSIIILIFDDSDIVVNNLYLLTILIYLSIILALILSINFSYISKKLSKGINLLTYMGMLLISTLIIKSLMCIELANMYLIFPKYNHILSDYFNDFNIYDLYILKILDSLNIKYFFNEANLIINSNIRDVVTLFTFNLVIFKGTLILLSFVYLIYVYFKKDIIQEKQLKVLEYSIFTIILINIFSELVILDNVLKTDFYNFHFIKNLQNFIFLSILIILNNKEFCLILKEDILTHKNILIIGVFLFPVVVSIDGFLAERFPAYDSKLFISLCYASIVLISVIYFYKKKLKIKDMPLTIGYLGITIFLLMIIFEICFLFFSYKNDFISINNLLQTLIFSVSILGILKHFYDKRIIVK